MEKGGQEGPVPREAAQNIKALSVAPAQVEAEDGWEDEHYRCQVAADHYGCLGRQERARLDEACPMPRPPGPTCPLVTPHLQGESPERRDGNQDSHEEGDHVVDGRECHTGAGASQTLTCTLLPGQSRDIHSGQRAVGLHGRVRGE